MNEASTPHTAPEATEDAPAHATTPQAGTSRYATVREAADFLSVSSETVRRMIRAGRLRAERVHRPQGTAFLVELPNATDEATRDVTDNSAVGRHDVTLGPAIPPALLAAEAWARGVVEPLTRTIAEQQHQLVSQAETIGRQTAELERAASTIITLGEDLKAAREEFSSLVASTAPQSAEPATDTPTPLSRLLALWRWLVLVLVVAVTTMVVLLAWPR